MSDQEITYSIKEVLEQIRAEVHNLANTKANKDEIVAIAKEIEEIKLHGSMQAQIVLQKAEKLEAEKGAAS